MNNADDPYLTAGQVAERLHVSTKTVHRWAEQGMLRCTYTLGGHRRFRLSDVERAITEFEEGRDATAPGDRDRNGDADPPPPRGEGETEEQDPAR